MRSFSRLLPPLLPRLAGGFLFLLPLLLAGCGPTTSDSETAETGARTPAAKPAATAAAQPAIAQVSVYLDMSGGMQGFVRPNAPGEPGSQFQQTVSAVLSDVNGLHGVGKAPAYFFVKEATAQDKNVLVPSSYNELVQTVSTGIKKPALGTEMPDMLREVLKRQQQSPGTVSIIVSDFIYGPANSSETWRVKTSVKDALSTADPAGLAVSVFAGTSEFRGSFHPGNRTGKQTLSGTRIPYYIWVLGPDALVQQVDRQALRRLADLPQVHFNTHYAAPRFAVLDRYQNTGGWYAVRDDARPAIAFTDLSAKEPAEIVVGLDLSGLPKSFWEPAYLKAHLRAAAENTDLQLLGVTAATAATQNRTDTKAYTHFAKIRLAKLPRAGSTLRLTLERAAPAWVAAYTTANDSNIARQGPKTFLLQDILQGVTDYFDGQPATKQVFALEVPLRRD